MTICPDDSRSGSGDGSTVAGMMVIHPTDTPTLCFSGFGFNFTGSRCDDGTVEPGEQCDDGNDNDGDGCSATCQVEACFTCSGAPSSCSPQTPYCCGDGSVDQGEACDDGNASDGDGCSASCQIEACYACTGQPSSCQPQAMGTACTSADPCVVGQCDGGGSCAAAGAVDCDDGSPCTTDTCEAPQGCVHAPAVRSCRGAGISKLLAVDGAGNGDKLVWKWSRGQSTSQTELADPTASTAYDLCVFAGTAASVVGEASVAAGAPNWSPVGSRGYRYRDAAGTQDGVRALLLKGSDRDHTTIVLKSKGTSLLQPPLPLPITVQLTNADTALCWSTTFAAADPNRTGRLRAWATAP